MGQPLADQKARALDLFHGHVRDPFHGLRAAWQALSKVSWRASSELPSLALALPFPYHDPSHATQAYRAPCPDNAYLQAHVASEAKVPVPS